MINYYHILGISQNASQKEIKEAYRKMALLYHPDRNPGSTYAEERFKEISQAYHTLRDPQKKSQHDHSLAYAAFKSTQSAFPYDSPSQRGRRRRPGAPTPTPRPPVNSRQNIIGTAWAFGIFFIMALLVVGASNYHSYHQEQVQARQNELAIGIYKKAEHFFKEANYDRSLQLLKTIDGQYNIPYDVSSLKQQVLSKIEEEASQNFEQNNFQKAAASYQLLANNKPGYDALIYAKLVNSYEMIPDYPQAILAYKEVIKAEPLTIEGRTRLAAIYFKLGDYEKALNYYLQASDIITEEYQKIYGKAFPLVVNPERTPASHYELHCGLALTFSKLGMSKQAHASLKWAIFVRPDAPKAHFLMGNNFWEAGNSSEACKKWEEAKKKGSKEASEQLKAHCRQ